MCNHDAMVALSPAIPEVAPQDNDLRWKIGVGVAVAWVLTQLWIASPLPFVLSAAAGIDLIASSQQFAWAHVAFAAATAFLLFDGRLIRSCWANVLLATAVALIVSYPLWMPSLGLVRDLDMRTLSRIPLPIDLVMTALAMIVAVFMAGRIFGRFGAALAVIALFPPSYFVGFVDGLNFTMSGLVSELSELLQGYILGQKMFGSIVLQLSTDFFFLFLAIGVGLDYMGWGRRVGAVSLRPLTRNGKYRVDRLSEFLAQRIFTASFALAIVLYLYGDFDPVIVGGLEAVILIGTGAALYLGCYITSGLLGSKGDGASGMRSNVSRAALGIAHFAALVAATTALVFGFTGQLIAGLVWLLGNGSLVLGGFAAPLLCMAVAFLAVLIATRRRSGRAARKLRTTFAVLPLLTLTWLMIVEGLSPGLSAFSGVLVLLFCLLGWRLVCDDSQDRSAIDTLHRYLAQDVASFCVSTARFMAGFALVSAFYWLLALWWFTVTGLQIM